jgi:hypothetical protein
LRRRGHLLALDEVGKGRRRLALERHAHEAEHQKVVDDVARKGHPHVLQVAREGRLEVDVAALAAHHDAAAEQLAHEDGPRGLDGRAGVVEVLQRHHDVRADADLAGRPGVDGVERVAEAALPARPHGGGVFALAGALAEVEAGGHDDAQTQTQTLVVIHHTPSTHC